MRIVLDMQGAQTESRFRGIGRYTLAFAQAIVRNRGEHEVLLALNGLLADSIEPIRAAFDGLLPADNFRTWVAPGPVKEIEEGNDARRETAELIREAFLASLRPDIILVSSLFEGYVDDAVTSIGRLDTTTPVCVILYDLIPLLNPVKYLDPNPSYRDYYARKISYMREAKLLLAISEHSRQEGLNALRGDLVPITTIGSATSNEFQPTQVDTNQSSALRKRLGISRSTVLYTGGADARKNLPRLIEAWARLPVSLRQTHQLLFAGDMSSGQINDLRQIANSHGLQLSELLFSGYVTDAELVQLYNLCKLYVFPSWHEGFGLPALEAMACGAPVIGANTSSLPEVIGLAEALFDPFDVAAISQTMARALEDESFRIRLKSNASQQAPKYSWENVAKRAVQSWDCLAEARMQLLPTKKLGSNKPKLAFVSPLPPERTGIADYSAELLLALASHYDITLIVNQDSVQDQLVKEFGPVRDADWLRTHAAKIDRVIYQMGNSPFHRHMLSLMKEIPGVVVLHDFFLSGLMYWQEFQAGESHAWTDALYASHGYRAVSDHFKTAATEKSEFCVNHYPANMCIFQYAKGVIVHSEHSRTLARNWYGSSAAAEWKVIPLLRTPPDIEVKRLARRQLAIDDNDFIVCSFGFLDPAKLNHRLLQAWLQSALSADKSCRLVFVGENHGGTYGVSLVNTISVSGLSDRISITGFASPEVFRYYLTAADLSVQLRTNSRGETSAAVLDSMNYGLPLIVNANGSMAELDAQAVCMLKDEFTDSELVEALENLWRSPQRLHCLSQRARTFILTNHAPKKCADHYAKAIESFYWHAGISMPALIKAISEQKNFPPSETELFRLSSTIATTLPLKQPTKRLFLDVTATCQNDLKTGIERVARALMLSLLKTPPPGYSIEPVYLANIGAAWQYNHAHDYTLRLLECPTDTLIDVPVSPCAGDILLTLDISVPLLQAGRSGLFNTYRNLGLSLFATVFDLLPVQQPEVFPLGAGERHHEWLETISVFDGAVCISKTVADDLRTWCDSNEINRERRTPFSIKWFHLGADVENSAPSVGMPSNAEAVLQQLKASITFLMVGTVEPRKGYLQAIDALSILVERGIDVNIVIVGSEGWKGLQVDMRRDIPETVERLRSHPRLNKSLFWLEGISDEYLEKVYAASTCLLSASYGEGFGLPLIEAAKNKLPIIARDIPVFREIAGECAFYYEANNPIELSQALLEWMALFKENLHPKSHGISWLSWQESTQEILTALGIKTSK